MPKRLIITNYWLTEVLKFKKWLMLRLWMEGRSALSVWVRWSQATRESRAEEVYHEKVRRAKRARERKGMWGPRGPSELSSVYNCRRQNQLCINLDASHEHILQRHADTPLFLLFTVGEVGVRSHRAPTPLRLSVITVSLRSRHPPGGLNLLINLVLIVCTKAPHHELICIHTSTLVDVPTTR